MSKLIECRKLTKSFARKNAIDNLDLNIEPGRTLGLVGPNGAGKTTLFSLVSGYLRPTSGEYLSSRMIPGLLHKRDVSAPCHRTRPF